MTGPAEIPGATRATGAAVGGGPSGAAPAPVPAGGVLPPDAHLIAPPPPPPGATFAPAPAAGIPDTDPSTAFALARQFDLVVRNVCSTYLGNERVVRLALACLMAEGHVLVEDRPGVGKTTLAKALARSIGLDFRRVQFTADLLPSDVTGAVVFDRERGALEFRPGPVFTNVLLADELNRASPKAQSALLESMEERQVSVEGRSYPLPRPFMVLATQNPFDAAGTFPLPHSQRDRFLLRVSLGYPDPAAEELLLDASRPRPEPEDLAAVCDPSTVAAFGAAARHVHVAAEVRRYVMDLVVSTRSHPDLAVGASPRAALALVRVASALALAQGRAYVVPDDIKEVAEPALAHRLLLQPAAELAGIGAGAIIRDITDTLPVPVGGRYN